MPQLVLLGGRALLQLPPRQGHALLQRRVRRGLAGLQRPFALPLGDGALRRAPLRRQVPRARDGLVVPRRRGRVPRGRLEGVDGGAGPKGALGGRGAGAQEDREGQQEAEARRGGGVGPGGGHAQREGGGGGAGQTARATTACPRLTAGVVGSGIGHGDLWPHGTALHQSCAKAGGGGSKGVGGGGGQPPPPPPRDPELLEAPKKFVGLN